jgi:hypothetical protein
MLTAAVQSPASVFTVRLAGQMMCRVDGVIECNIESTRGEVCSVVSQR